uniref:Endonuclease 2 n=1 Tax=Cavenderia fasciculata TaxID=261658 RepID=B2XX79_CACFS|nr:endonuclease 2 [Cavenderia fasciculata]ABX45201.1 endonuclease 2 [Cavenderia fasciculata]
MFWLGQCYLEWHDFNFRLIHEHSDLGYSENLCIIFRNSGLTIEKANDLTRFSIRSSDEFTEFELIFYKNKKKALPPFFGDFLNERSLSYWFLDTGFITEDDSFILNTSNYSFEEVVEIQKVLYLTFGLQTSLSNYANNVFIKISLYFYLSFLCFNKEIY